MLITYFFWALTNSSIQNIQKQLRGHFKISSLGELSHQLGMEADVKTGGISLQQTTYIKKILQQFQMTNCKSSSISMNLGVANSLCSFYFPADRPTINFYQSAIHSVIQPAVNSQPDISHSVRDLRLY